MTSLHCIRLSKINRKITQRLSRKAAPLALLHAGLIICKFRVGWQNILNAISDIKTQDHCPLARMTYQTTVSHVTKDNSLIQNPRPAKPQNLPGPLRSRTTILETARGHSRKVWRLCPTRCWHRCMTRCKEIRALPSQVSKQVGGPIGRILSRCP